MTPNSSANMVNGFDMSQLETLDPAMQALIERRARLLGPAYRLLYAKPLEIVRGEGVHLYDADGTQYLDAYNNVPSVGHSHPTVVAAIQRQAGVLNTHTRYASRLLVDYAERLLSTYPSELGNVMFTCTGSEAVDLALRIARFTTGGEGVIVTENAYHGVTTAAAEISPSLGAAVPVGRSVWTVPPPLPTGDPQSDARRLTDHVRTAIGAMQRHGVKPAAFIADSLFSSDGILPGSPGLLEPVVDAVHRAGGLYIADEVQPGFARTGDHMWGFQRYGIVPDCAVMGKPMGNGMPIAGVAVRPELLEEFGSRVRYFNTFGGNSVSIAAADAVLDVIEDEGLQANSRIVGAQLLSSVRDVTASRPDVAGVRGAGLYVAVDFVDPGDGRPDGDRALAVVNGLRDRHVLISATGKHGNTLKIRPPLPFTAAHVDQLAAALSDTFGALA
jgi:4-aminobutyrate aminotransferase-like enzyme